MILFFIFICTLISCYIFERVTLTKHLHHLLNSYESQFAVMSNKDLSDDLKQKELFKHIKEQLRLLAAISLKMIFFLSPFLLWFLLDFFGLQLYFEETMRLEGIGISILAVILFLLYKKQYVKIFSSK